jgi:hypothetical protein
MRPLFVPTQISPFFNVESAIVVITADLWPLALDGAFADDGFTVRSGLASVQFTPPSVVFSRKFAPAYSARGLYGEKAIGAIPAVLYFPLRTST